MEKLDQIVKTWFPQVKKIVNDLFAEGYHEKEKRDFRDLVSDIDVTVEKFLIGEIKKLTGEQTILAEESSNQDTNVKASHLWCIDPIDGTANMLKQRQDFATMIAYFEDGEPVLAYIYDIMSDKLFWSVKGQGVYLNDEKISVDKHQLNNSLIAMDAQKQAGTKFFELVQKYGFQMRFIGASSADSIRVLENRFGATFCPDCSPWDRAPLILFAEELGLKMSQMDGSPTTLTGRESYYFGSQEIFNELEELSKGDSNEE